MNAAMSKNLEGLVIKDSAGVYTPNARHWLKMKKDYLDDGSMADSADLLVLGAYYGSGNKGSLLATLLLGVYDKKTNSYRTVCKCGNGLSDAEIEKKQAVWKAMMTKCPAYEALNPMFKMDRKYLPDLIVIDPKKSPVYEIAGAEFSASNHHTAAGISIRFPRFVKLREDKDHDSATSLSELEDLFKASKSIKKPDAILDDDEDEEEEEEKPPQPLKKLKMDDSGNSNSNHPNGNDNMSAKKTEGAISEARTVCKYNQKCTRNNVQHFKEYAHPGIVRKSCVYGIDCNRKNPQHFKDEMHWDELIQTQ
jgi:DNA ligase-3